VRAVFAALAGVLGLAASLAGQSSYPTFTSIDDCGGQSAFLTSGYILEESSGFCGSSAVTVASVTKASGVFTITASVTGSLAGLQPNDEIYMNSASSQTPACLTRANGFSVTSVDVTNTIVKVTSCGTGAPSISSLYLYGQYVHRYELKLLTKSGSSWTSVPPTLLSTATTRGGLYSPNSGLACSFGNPSGYYDGANYYIAFIAQNSATCGVSPYYTPSSGTQYDLYACNLGGSPTTALTGMNCGKIASADTTSGQQGAFLDPHLFTNGHLYASERDNSTVYSTINLTMPFYDIWSVDDITINWSAAPPSLNMLHPFVFGAGETYWNTGRARWTAGCEQYYKLTGLLNMPEVSGQPVVRAFFQANDINAGSSVEPFGNYQTGNTCDELGAGGYMDQFIFSGLFYADLTPTPFGSTAVYVGTDYEQFYPNPARTSAANSCLTPDVTLPGMQPYNFTDCYGEFPWVFKNGTKMLFLGNTVTPAAVINTCAGTSMLGCKENYTAEVVQAELNADYSLASVPMSLAAATPFSTMQEVGSANCGQLLSPDGMIGDCGVLALTPVYGNCGHLDVDEASQYVTCGNLTSFDFGASGNTFSFLTRRTMIFPLAASILNPAVQVVGPVLITGATSGGASTTKVGVTLLSQ
jgi:hypothetical protein